MAATAQCNSGTPGGAVRQNSITNFFSPQQSIKPRESPANQGGILGFFKKLPATSSALKPQSVEKLTAEGTENQAPPGLDDSLTDFEMDDDTSKTVVKAKKEIKSRTRKNKRADSSGKKSSSKKAADKKQPEVNKKNTKADMATRETESATTEATEKDSEAVMEMSYEDFLAASLLKGSIETTETSQPLGEISLESDEEYEVKDKDAGKEEEEAGVLEEHCDTRHSRTSSEPVDGTRHVTHCVADTDPEDAVECMDVDEDTSKPAVGSTDEVECIDVDSEEAARKAAKKLDTGEKAAKKVDKKACQLNTSNIVVKKEPVKTTAKQAKKVNPFQAMMAPRDNQKAPAIVIEAEEQEEETEEKAGQSEACQPKSAVSRKLGRGKAKPANKVNPFQAMMAQRGSQQPPPPIVVDGDEEETQGYKEPATPIAAQDDKSNQGAAITNFFSFTTKKPIVEEKKEFSTIDIEAEVYGSPKKCATRRPSQNTSPESLKHAEIKSKSNVVVDCTVEDETITDLGSAPITPKKTRKIVKPAAIFDMAKRKINVEAKPNPDKNSITPKAPDTEAADDPKEVKQKGSKTADDVMSSKKKSKDVKKDIKESKSESAVEDENVKSSKKKSKDVKKEITESKTESAVDEKNVKSSKKKSKDVKKEIKESKTEPVMAPEDQKAQQEQQRAVNVAKMAALDSVNVPKKATAQATLSFTGKLVKASTPAQDKASVTTPTTAGKVDTPAETKTAGKTARRSKVSNKKSKSAEVNVKTPVKSRTSGKRKRSSDKSSSGDEDPESSPNSSPVNVDSVPTRKKRALRGVYKITPMKPQRKSQRGLKMTFTRLRDLPEGDKERHIEKKVKVDVARQLIHKAKSKTAKRGAAGKKKKASPKSKTRQKSTTQSKRGSSSSSAEDCTPLRRSSRASSQVAKMAISECLEPPVKDSAVKSRHKSSEDFSDAQAGSRTPKKARRRSAKAASPGKTAGKTPQKGGKTPQKKSTSKDDKQPAKKAAKLASIFTKSKAAATKDDDVQVIAVDIDPELARVRREFLLSGVPDTLRRQQIVTSAQMAAGDYAPLPTVSHVQQSGCHGNREDVVDPWSLGDVGLPLRSAAEHEELGRDSKLVTPLGQFTGCDRSTLTSDTTQLAREADLPSQVGTGCDRSTLTSDTTQLARETDLPSQPPPVDWPAEVERYLLAEVHRYNPSFPVRRVYKQLTAKLEDKPEDKLAEKLPEAEEEKKETPNETASGKRSRKRKFGGDDEVTSLRRSKRRRESAEVIILDGSPSFTNSPVGDLSTSGDSQSGDSKKEEYAEPEVQWTEKYAPSCHKEVLGNSKLVSRLRSWLSDWKQLTDLEARRMRKQLLKQAKRQNKSTEEVKKDLGGDWWLDDDSDFDLDSSDSEEEEDSRLCNTMLVTGPHGAGKTAMVYALAQELGYKVFEVNAASRRAGRQILTQLQEATQSHQVAKSALDSMFTTFMATETSGEDKKEKEKKKLPTAFTNFFKKGPQDSGSQDKKVNLKERKEKKCKAKSPAKTKKGSKAASVAAVTALPPGVMDSPRRGLQLSSTSLILFEEVDVVFEEDKGFWAAIQTFMGSTKRPIILTASNPQLSTQILGRHEQIKIRRPPAINVASYLQLVCVAEKKRASFADLLALVEHHHGDLRGSLLALQWWLLSGADTNASQQDLLYSKKFFENNQNGASQTAVMSAQSMKPVFLQEDSADEFQIAKRPARRRAQVLRDDDSSCDDFLSSPQKLCPLPVISEDSQDSPAVDEDSQMGPVGQGTAETPASDLEKASVSTPLLHGGCLEAVVGCPRNKAHHMSIMQCLSSPTSPSVMESCCHGVLSHYSSQHPDALYAHLPHQLCLPLVQFTPSSRLPLMQLPQDTPAASKRSRIKNMDDLYDSEQSDNESPLVPSAECPPDTAPADPSAITLPQTATASQRLSHAAVSSLAELYDVLSFTDSYLSSLPAPSREGPCTGLHCRVSSTVSAGLSLELPKVEEPSCWRDRLTEEVRTSCHLQSVAKANHTLQKILHSADKLSGVERSVARQCLSLPVGVEDLRPTGVRTRQECNQLVSMCSSHQKALEGVQSVLPNNMSCEHRAMATDYMPYVRHICQAEQLRRVNNTKRRFFHYCDQISLNITRKTAVLETLNWSFH